jgi:hypothetical protein
MKTALKTEAGRIDKSEARREKEREMKYVNMRDKQGHRCYVVEQARGKKGGV